MSAASAAGEIRIEYYSHPRELKGKLSDNREGKLEAEPEFLEPAGKYVNNTEVGGEDGIYWYEEECSTGNIFEDCVGLHTVVKQNSEGPLPRGYVKLEHLGTENEFAGVRSLVYLRFGWKPAKRRHGARRRERLGLANPADPHVQDPCSGEPVDCATGNDVESQTDLSIPALGVPFVLERTYNSQAAVEGSSAGLFGYGWSSSFSDHLEFDSETGAVTVVQANGSTVTFFGHIGAAGEFAAPGWSQAKLVYTEEGAYKFTLPDQETFTFNSSGRLLSESERNGNTTTVTYDEEEDCEGGCHKVLKSIVIADPADRKITLTLNSGGQVETATDPMGHAVHYGYESGNLASVTKPGESSPRWTFKYNSSHELTEMVNGVGGKTTNEYNAFHQVVSQTSPLGDTLRFVYEEQPSKLAGYRWCSLDEEEPEEEDEEVGEPTEAEQEYYAPPPEEEATITNEATGAVEREHFNSEDELESITRAYGTPNATTETFTYNPSDETTTRTDGDKHMTEYGYDVAGDRTSEKNADGDETKWEYNGTHDLIGVTEPNGEKTTIERDSHGNPLSVSRPAPKGETQTIKYKYNSRGELESMTNPLGHEWKYEYDSYGDRTAEIDPEGNERTWEYSEDSQETATVSPRGNAKGEPAKFKTTIERNAQGRPVKITDPLGHATEYRYNADGDTESVTDANKHTTAYTYNGEDELIKVKEANGDATETEYNKAGQVVAQIDGNKHKTTYKRNVLEQITEFTDPLGRVTTEEYDAAGNLVKLTDPEKRTTSYTYDPANRLTEISYSSGKPATIKYEYNEDGDRTKMIDGTGTTINTYDQLDRLIESENGHKETVKYEYDLAGDQTKITYPNGKAVTQAFDKDDRMEKVADWLEHAIKFTYNEDADLKAVTFPSDSKDEDKYTYNDTDQMTEAKMVKGSETLASLVYTRDADGFVKKTTAKKLPDSEVAEATYDEDNRLTKYGTSEYKYDAANNPTSEAGTSNTINEGDELEKAGSTSYAYDELGDRIKATPEKGPTTSYAYDQAGNLTAIERPEEGGTLKIEDAYTYNGEALRASETINGTTNYLTWDTANIELPLILSNGTDSFIYGPRGMPVEQINNTTGTATYLHHDQAGSTRLLTGSTGTATGKCSYGAYGTPTCEGTATTPLGYDGQYTSSDTGLVYLRNRVYDPATAQFLSVDPLEKLTGAPYTYAGDNPVNEGDPTGLLGWSEVGQAIGVGLVCVATDGAGCVAAGLADLDANVVSNDYEAVAESCRAGEEESSSLTDLAGFALGAGIGGLADGSLSEEAKKALESTSAGQAALKQLVGLGAGSSTLTTLAYAQGHESSGSNCSCAG